MRSRRATITCEKDFFESPKVESDRQSVKRGFRLKHKEVANYNIESALISDEAEILEEQCDK